MVVETGKPVRYAITNLAAYGLDQGDDLSMRLRAHLRRWAFDAVDIVQLREKHLETGELFALAQAGIQALRTFSGPANTSDPAIPVYTLPRFLVNGRPDIAAAVGADGVHLPSGPGTLTPAQVRKVFFAAGLPRCFVSVSCHTLDEVHAARDAGADLLLFGPVFEKRVAGKVVVPGLGLATLGQACEAAKPLPVLALGGVTAANTPACLQAGARGVASIRLFAPASHETG